MFHFGQSFLGVSPSGNKTFSCAIWGLVFQKNGTIKKYGEQNACRAGPEGEGTL